MPSTHIHIGDFYDIKITMYENKKFSDPHFHIHYGRCHAQMNIINFGIMKGNLSPRTHGITVEWASMHQKELLDNWERVLKQKPLKKIEPLK